MSEAITVPRGEDCVYESGIRLYDRRELYANRLLSINRSVSGVTIHTAEWKLDELGPEVVLSLHQMSTLRDWLSSRIAEIKETE